MADDIDIEEHDVLDNPQLKTIFPCITNIKSEVIDYEEENEYREYIDQNKVIKKEPFEYETNTNINSNVIIFGTKPSTPQPYQKASTSSNKESMINQISFENNDDYEKSDSTDEDPDIIPCSVVLEDCDPLLANNSCYCSECEILFPTPNTIESHRMVAHSFLVAVSNNKAVKSTSKICIKDYNQMNNTTRRPELLCQHCKIYFPCKDDLISHLNSLLPNIEETCVDEKSLQSQCDTKLTCEEVLYITCTICSAYYKHNVSFTSHIILNHGDPHVEKVRAPFHPYCRYCKVYVTSPKKYNCHISVRHTDFFLMRNNYEKGQYQCHMCKQNFLSAEAERKHRELEHPTNVKHCDLKFRRALMLGLNVKNEKSIEHASDIEPLKSLRINKNKALKNENITTIAPLKTKNELANTFDDNKLVPKSHLFKCDKCQIHYISPSAAFEHTKHCTLSKGDWKCRPCKRTFNMADRQMHIYQHTLNGRFKVIVISEEVLARVIHRCGKCNVCFDNTTFSKYHSSGCKQCPSVECDICHLRIHKFAVKSHSRTHTELGLTKNDLIITDYHKVSKSTPIPKDPNSISDLKCDDRSRLPPASSNKKARKANYNKLYYCPNCKMYTTRHRIQDGHEKGDCIERKCGRELCKLCGLVFSKKGFVTHKAYHKMFNIKLNTMVFINIINGKRIRPPFPEFMLCSNCQVYFVSLVALQNHVCNTEEHKSCQFCQKKFSDLALKLHLAFHQVTNVTTAIAKRLPASKTPLKNKVIGKKKTFAVKKSVKETETRIPTPIHDLIKKYESLVTVWNILYRCQTCDIVFDSYDSTVEHCQDHFCNMENYNLNIKYCKECNLKFVDKCYSRHEHLHSQNGVSLESFVIIDCDYSVLLSDDWQKVFNKLSRDQLQQVMSKSIYNEIRDVRMDLVCNGDLGSVYKCSICNVSVDLQFIVDHVKNRECDVDDIKFTCNVCNVGFRQKKAANAHVQKHELSDVPYRIVSFNNPKYLFIDEALIKSAKADDLKFVRCQYCGKLINKSLYRIHMYKHNYRKKIKLLKSQHLKCKNSVTSSVKGKVSQILQGKIDQKSMYRYHICINCNVALLKYSTHVCREKIIKKKCPKCQIFISADPSSLWRHNKVHKNYPMLSHKTIKVTYFNPSEIKKNVNNVIKISHTSKTPFPVSAPVSALQKRSTKIQFVRCAHCTKCISQKYFRGHNCKYVTKIVKCNLCGIHTDTRNYTNHLDMHKRISFTKNDITITTFDYKAGVFLSKANSLSEAKSQDIEGANINSSRDTESRSDIACKPDYIRVYKCTECKLFFVCRANLLEHLSYSLADCDSQAGEKCEYCNLNFHSSDIKQHKTVQFCKTRKVSKINVCTVLLKNTDPNNENNWLSYCKKCDFYNTNALKCHFNTQHKNASKTVPCLKCGVRFASVCIRKHNIFHHGSVDVPFSDLNVEVMEDYTLEEAGYISKTQNDSLNSSQLSAEENIVDKKIKIEKRTGANAGIQNEIQNVYRCSTCNLHFHHKTSLQSHILRGEHGVEQVPCKVCGMPFSKTSMKKHIIMHEFNNTFNLIDSLERSNSGSSWCKSTNTSLNTSDTLDSVPTTSDIAVSNDECEEITSKSKITVPMNLPSQSNLPTVEVKTREAADSSGTSSNEISSTNSIPYANTRTEVKLFKCGQCDVYFLTAECCSYHTVNHTPLDPTEYISCKICDLQFLNRSLDEHMRCHREKIFNMDTLVVDEYQPDGPNVKVDTYAAIDRLKSKLVSTTTESD